MSWWYGALICIVEVAQVLGSAEGARDRNSRKYIEEQLLLKLLMESIRNCIAEINLWLHLIKSRNSIKWEIDRSMSI